MGKAHTITVLLTAPLLLLACAPAPLGLVPAADPPSPEEAQAPTGQVPELATTIPSSAEPTEPTSETKTDISTGDDSESNPQAETGIQGTPEATFPPCGSEPIFTVSPVDLDSIDDITPLGNLGPPGHTFPTDHIYLRIAPSASADRSDKVILYSPGEMTITNVTASDYAEAGFRDYTVVLKPCEEIEVIFIHVSSLSEEIFGDTSFPAGYLW